MRVVFTPAAGRDLVGIALRIAEHNPARAVTYVDELQSYCRDIAIFSEAGTPRPEWGDGVLARFFRRKYAIVFRVRSGDVQILRIVHGARDLDAVFDDDPLPR